MEVGKFDFSKHDDRIVVKLIWNDEMVAVHDVDTLEIISTTMPSYLQDEYLSLLKKNRDKIK